MRAGRRRVVLPAVAACVAIVGLVAWPEPGDAQQQQRQRDQQAPRQQAFPDFRRADLVNGRAVVVGASQGGATQGAQAQACFPCHGLDGAGDGTGAFPRLSGQPAFYLYKQLMDYAARTRPNDIMSPIAQALTPAEMEDVAAYYAAQTGAPFFPAPPADPLMIQHGGALSAIGSAQKGIQACVNCHGPSGTGMEPSFPYLASQYASYTELQLQLWQQGKRQNDPLNVMADIAKRMSADDIRAVAAYFASVRPPGANVQHRFGASLPPEAPTSPTPSGTAR